MKDSLYKSFFRFFDLAKQTLDHARQKDERILYLDPISELRVKADFLERAEEFTQLVGSISAIGVIAPVKRMLKNFLRRSEIYTRLANKESINPDAGFEQLWEAIHGRKIREVSLRLMESVKFPELLIDFGTFKIQKFSKDELDDFFNNQVNRIFYPEAMLDTGYLSEYWYIVRETTWNSRGMVYTPEQSSQEREQDEADIDYVKWEFPDRVMQLLALHDWFQEFDFLGWVGFRIPLTLTFSDNVLESPPVYRKPEIMITDDEFDQEGEIAIQRAYYIIDVGSRELRVLKEIVRDIQTFLTEINLEQCGWEFVKTAMGYLAKAFLTTGLEQLLWHLCVLEALFGERENTMESIRGRLCHILGKDDKEKKKIRAQFNDLYGFRSDLVHGRAVQKKVLYDHMELARIYAREALCWFLSYLSAIHSELSKRNTRPEEYPRRKEILALLDHNKEALDRIGWLISASPLDFPRLKAWRGGWLRLPFEDVEEPLTQEQERILREGMCEHSVEMLLSQIRRLTDKPEEMESLVTPLCQHS